MSAVRSCHRPYFVPLSLLGDYWMNQNKTLPTESLYSHPELMVSVSGVRGAIPDALSIDRIIAFLRAFGSWLPGQRVIIGRDSRPSGEYLEHLAVGILQSMGKDVLSLGVVPTPTVKAVTRSQKAAGGIMISASHNPIQWNAFKFIGPKGFFLSQDHINVILSKIQTSDYLPNRFEKIGSLKAGPDLWKSHLENVLARVDVRKIRNRKFKVLMDSVNGGGSLVLPALLRELGCMVEELYCQPDGRFPRPPEPTPKALKSTARKVKETDVDIGFALDPDADRLVVLTPLRGSLLEEYTLPLSYLSLANEYKKNSKVVVNLSTSFINDHVAAAFGHKVLRSKVGEANVVASMIENRAIFGGEGNGGVIDPKIDSYGRDSLSGVAHILNMLANEKVSIDTVMDRLPAIFMEKTTAPLAGLKIEDLYGKFLSEFSNFGKDQRDGLRLSSNESWIHIRPSNTEPIVRLIGEAKSGNALKALMSKAREIVGN